MFLSLLEVRKILGHPNCPKVICLVLDTSEVLLYSSSTGEYPDRVREVRGTVQKRSRGDDCVIINVVTDSGQRTGVEDALHSGE